MIYREFSVFWPHFHQFSPQFYNSGAPNGTKFPNFPEINAIIGFLIRNDRLVPIMIYRKISVFWPHFDPFWPQFYNLGAPNGIKFRNFPEINAIIGFLIRNNKLVPINTFYHDIQENYRVMTPFWHILTPILQFRCPRWGRFLNFFKN
jgi:hypothetical protein